MYNIYIYVYNLLTIIYIYIYTTTYIYLYESVFNNKNKKWQRIVPISSSVFDVYLYIHKIYIYNINIFICL